MDTVLGIFRSANLATVVFRMEPSKLEWKVQNPTDELKQHLQQRALARSSGVKVLYVQRNRAFGTALYIEASLFLFLIVHLKSES